MALSSADPNAFLAIGMQSALGTPQVTASKLRYCRYLSGTDVQPALDVVDLREGGQGLDWSYTYKRKHTVAGQILANMRPELIGQLFQGAIGAATWNGGSAPATALFHTGHASFPFMTMLVQFPGSTLPQLISDAIFTGITIEGAAGEPWKVTIPFLGIKHGASFAALTPTYESEEPFLFHHSPTYVLDGAGDTKVTKFTMSLGLGIEEVQTQAVTLEDIAVQNRDVNWEIMRQYVSTQMWSKINMGAIVSPTTSVATGDFRAEARYDSGLTLKSVELQSDLISYRSDSLTELDPDGKTVYETIAGKALKGATHVLFARITNAHASAYVS